MIISQYTYFRCFDEILWFLQSDPWILWDKSLLSKWTRMYLCSHHWKYVICISAFLFVFTLYLFEFQKRERALSVITWKQKGCEFVDIFPWNMLSLVGSCFKVGVAKVGCALLWFCEQSSSEVGSPPKSQKNGWTQEKSSAAGKNKFCTSPLQKSQHLLLCPSTC